jgi:hypothetical protein
MPGKSARVTYLCQGRVPGLPTYAREECQGYLAMPGKSVRVT